MNAPTQSYEIAQPTPLHKKCLIAKLTMRRVTLTRKDLHLQEQVRNDHDDQAITLNRKLFREDGNPVRSVFTAYNAIYTKHRELTFPYMDKGPRVLPVKLYERYTSSIKEDINNLNAKLEALEGVYEQCIDQDIAFRNKFKIVQISRDEYPSYEDILSGTSYALDIRPMPDSSHFVYGISEEDRRTFDANAKHLEDLIRQDTVSRITEPLKHLLEKIAVPIGTKSVDENGKEVREGLFRDTTYTNITEALAHVRDMTVEESPAFIKLLDELENKFKRYSDHPEYLRESPFERTQAYTELSAIETRLSGYDF
jgi:hypothetical protein